MSLKVFAWHREKVALVYQNEIEPSHFDRFFLFLKLMKKNI